MASLSVNHRSSNPHGSHANNNNHSSNTPQYCATPGSDVSFCVLWSPLPPITWILPFVGHLGIANAHGVASDFQGPYTVGDDGRMAFGPPTRALPFTYTQSEAWDAAIDEANQVYRGRMHHICCDNCHSHVAYALNRIPGLQAYGVSQWNMVNLAVMIFFRARFLSWWGCVYQFGPFVILLLLLIVLKRM
jgi:transmembrane protein 222